MHPPLVKNIGELIASTNPQDTDGGEREAHNTGQKGKSLFSVGSLLGNQANIPKLLDQGMLWNWKGAMAPDVPPDSRSYNVIWAPQLMLKMYYPKLLPKCSVLGAAAPGFALARNTCLRGSLVAHVCVP